ncbi:hypothetical protein B9Z55_027000 [Caenorhabditis nigoni]|uniref:F-box domain-containing protein n=1 Tax=Caenorhabditis nigoni TaxID=1611254 RepID=A0A2G5SI86_9PELO|nr:hypothetical protein B9Z55_027000 [Caenorhabditis nigoni]
MSPKLDEASQNNPKYRTITDLPVHIFEEICGHLGDNYQKEYWFTFRHVSKSFRNVVDSWNPSEFRRIEFSSTARGLIIHFDGYPVSYSRKSKNWSEINIHNNNEIAYSINQYGNFRDLAVDDLMSVLTSPGGYKLQNLIISENIDNRFAQRLSAKFKAVGTNIDVNHVDLYAAKVTDPIPVNSILNLFRSIKKIDIKANGKQRITQRHIKPMIDTINGIDAFRGRVVKIDRFFTEKDDKILFLFDLKIPKIALEYWLRGQRAIDIVPSLLKSPNLEYFRLGTWIQRGKVEFEEYLKELGAENDRENPNMYKYQISGSDEFFEIEMNEENRHGYFHGIHIRRKSNST